MSAMIPITMIDARPSQAVNAIGPADMVLSNAYRSL
jgi:hypothetical protein